MFANYGPENIIRTRLISLGLSVDAFAVLAGSKQSTLSRNLRGTAPLDPNDAKRYLLLTAELTELASLFEPLPIGLIDPRVLEVMLDDFRSKREHWTQLNVAMTEIRRGIDETLASRTRTI